MAFSIDVLGMSPGEAYLASVSAKPDGLVQSGEITEDMAARKLAAVERHLEMRAKAGAYLEKVTAELEEQVAAGELSAEEADAKLAEIKEGIANRIRFRSVTEEVKAKVEAGEMTEEQAEARLVATRKHMFGNEGN